MMRSFVTDTVNSGPPQSDYPDRSRRISSTNIGDLVTYRCDERHFAVARQLAADGVKRYLV
jgi:hypothetical protein